ncbi:YktB family protein [Caldalkalibacillus salinus]|uniref:YktB family protein n=1 Tax=Caldalkalibacillus salinus TaxID=2803787 RepID=UPI0019222EFB|nr:DUF1054 domain-containing protein [Caldalkalibacillus salinus]
MSTHTFTGFTEDDFNTFHIEGLDARMEAIKERIQPKFRQIGDVLTEEMTHMLGNDMYLHIAKHARRTVNPPHDTWLAIAPNQRGYKKHPHFQVGLFDDHVFIWLAFIYELPYKREIAQTFLKHLDQLDDTIPNDYVISLDHTKKDAKAKDVLKQQGLKDVLVRFRDVKKAEFLVGRHIAANDSLLSDGERFMQYTKDTLETLVPLYQLAYQEQ